MDDKENENYDSYESIAQCIEVILLALLGAITGGTFISLMTNLKLDDNKTAIIIINVFIIALLIGLSITVGIKERQKLLYKQVQHKYTSNKFYAIALDIQTQFTLDVERREHDKTFLKNIVGRFNDIIQLALPIDKNTYVQYEQAKKNNDISLPINIGDIEKMDIVLENIKTKPEVVTDDDIDQKLSEEIDRWLKKNQ